MSAVAVAPATSRSRVLAFGLATVALAFAAPASAEAASGSSEREAKALVERLEGSDAKKVFQSYSPRERRLVMDALEVVSWEAVGGAQCPDDGSDPSCYETLPAADADAEVVTVENARSSAADALRGSGCKVPRKRPGVYGRNRFGARMFGWFLDTYWCWSGNRITQFTSSAYPEIYNFFWDYDGAVLNRITSAQDKLWYMHKAAGKFTLCITKVGCVRSKVAKVKITVVKDGYGWGSFQ